MSKPVLFFFVCLVVGSASAQSGGNGPDISNTLSGLYAIPYNLISGMSEETKNLNKCGAKFGRALVSSMGDTVQAVLETVVVGPLNIADSLTDMMSAGGDMIGKYKTKMTSCADSSDSDGMAKTAVNEISKCLAEIFSAFGNIEGIMKEMEQGMQSVPEGLKKMGNSSDVPDLMSTAVGNGMAMGRWGLNMLVKVGGAGLAGVSGIPAAGLCIAAKGVIIEPINIVTSGRNFASCMMA